MNATCRRGRSTSTDTGKTKTSSSGSTCELTSPSFVQGSARAVERRSSSEHNGPGKALFFANRRTYEGVRVPLLFCADLRNVGRESRLDKLHLGRANGVLPAWQPPLTEAGLVRDYGPRFVYGSGGDACLKKRPTGRSRSANSSSSVSAAGAANQVFLGVRGESFYVETPRRVLRKARPPSVATGMANQDFLKMTQYSCLMGTSSMRL